MSDWISASFGNLVQTQNIPKEVTQFTDQTYFNASYNQWQTAYAQTQGVTGAIQGMPVQVQQGYQGYTPQTVPKAAGGDWGGAGGAAVAGTVQQAVPTAKPVQPTVSYVPGQVSTPQAGTLFVARTPEYNIVKGKQAGALNDPRTIQGANGTYYQVTRTGTDKYDIKVLDAKVGAIGEVGDTLTYSPSPGLVVTNKRTGVNSMETMIVYGADEVVKVIPNSQLVSTEYIASEISKVYESGKAVNPVPAQQVRYSPETKKDYSVAGTGFSATLEPEVAPGGAPSGEGRGATPSDDEILQILSAEEEEPAEPGGSNEGLTYETFSVTHPGYIDLVSSETGEVIKTYDPVTGKPPGADAKTFAGITPDVSGLKDEEAAKAEEVKIPEKEEPLAPTKFDEVVLGKAKQPIIVIAEKPDGFGDEEPPENQVELEYVFSEALQVYNPDGMDNGQNARLSKYFPGLIPYIIAGTVDPVALDHLIGSYESTLSGSYSATSGYWDPQKGLIPAQIQAPFNDLDLKDKEQELRNFFISATNEGVPPGYAVVMMYNLINSVEDNNDKLRLEQYIRGNRFEKELRQFGTGSPIKDLLNWIGSDTGLTSLGSLAGLVGMAGAAATGGIAAVGAAALTSVFSTTELVNAFGDAAWKDKGEQQRAGVYAPDHLMTYNRSFDSYKSSVFDFGKNYKNWDEKTRQAELERLKKQGVEIGTELRRESTFFYLLDAYDNKLQEWKNLIRSLDNYSTVIDPLTGELTGVKDLPAEITIIPPKDGKVEWPEGTTINDKGYTFTKEGSGSFSVRVTDKDGNVIKTEQVTYLPGAVVNKDYSLLEKYGSSSSVDKPLVSDQSTLYHIIAPPDSVVKVGPDYYSVGQSGGEIGFRVVGGDTIGVEVSKDGYVTATRNLYVVTDPEVTYAPALKPIGTTAQPPEHGTIVLNTAPDTVVYINGQPWKRTATANKIDVSVPGQYNVRVVAKDGTTSEKTIYVGAGLSYSIADPAPEKEYKSSSGGGGGGGGGGSSGGGYGGAKQSDPSVAFITYGPTCDGAKIWQDEVEVAPVIGEIYSIEPGYHSIKVEREGKKPWLKTVYAMKGDTVTISPAFEDLEVEEPVETEEPIVEDPGFPKRVFVNSNPSGGKVLLNGGATGQWTPCYFELNRGLYYITVIKSGYKDYNIVCWVGDVIAWGDQALALAQVAGVV